MKTIHFFRCLWLDGYDV